MPRRNAFTLVEILMVVAIIGMISAMILPSIAPRDDVAASAGARQVMSDVMMAQSFAVSSQIPVYVVFTPAATATGPGGSYTVMSVLPSTPMLHPVTRAPWVVEFGRGDSGLGSVRLDTADLSGNTALMFDESGAPFSIPASGGLATPLTSGTIVVTCGTRRIRVSVEPTTAHLSITE